MMYGLRNKSVLFKMRRPETRIGRHNTNHVVLTKSLKVSRFHAVINFLSDTPLIRDVSVQQISEWGVYLNGVPIGKNRWAELKLGDMLALGAVKVEDGGHLLEVVLWEPEDKTPLTNPKIEVIDITQGDDDVISISDEEGEAPEKKCTTSQAPPSPANHVAEKVTSNDVTVISDAEDDAEQPTLVCEAEPEQIPLVAVKVPLVEEEAPSAEENIAPLNETKFMDRVPMNTDASTQFEEIPLENETMVSSNEIKFIECPSAPLISVPASGIKVRSLPAEPVPVMSLKIDPPKDLKLVNCAPTMDTKFVDVTPTMNGLLLRSSSKLSENLADSLPQAFQSILNYSSEEEEQERESYPFDSSGDSASYENGKFEEREPELYSSTRMVTEVKTTVMPPSPEDLPDEVRQKRAEIEKAFNDGYGYKSPLNVFSGYYEDHDSNDAAESSDSSQASEEIPIKTTAPIIHRTLLTNKIAKIAVISPLPNKSVGKRRRRTRGDSPDSIHQRATSAERMTKSPRKHRTRESRKTPPAAPEEPKAKDPSRDKAAKKESMKQAREKVKALYFGLPVRPERNPSTRPQPKVKITDKNRGDFLTKLELPPVPRNPTKAHNEPKNYDTAASNQSMNTSLEEPNTDRFYPNEAPKPRSRKARQTQPEPRPASSHDPVKSIDEILDGIDIPKVPSPSPPPPEEDFNNVVVPVRKSERTIEICVDFSKPPLLPGSNPKSNGGASILKKSNESPEGKKRVRFPSEITTKSQVPKKKCLGPPNCFDCGENCLSRKLSQKNRVAETCYNCFRDGHIAKDCRRQIMCYNCKEFGHKGNQCPLPDVRKAKQMSRDPRIKDKIINKLPSSRWDVGAGGEM